MSHADRPLDAPPVEWDEELAQFARDYAPICQMQHSSGPYGENLAGGAGGGYNIERAFNSWASEGDHYDWNQPGVLEATVNGETMGLGHFTQVVWKATTKIGCAAVTCGDGTLFTGYGDVSPPRSHPPTCFWNSLADLDYSPSLSSASTRPPETST